MSGRESGQPRRRVLASYSLPGPRSAQTIEMATVALLSLERGRLEGRGPKPKARQRRISCFQDDFYL